jgi:hypothetical protein
VGDPAARKPPGTSCCFLKPRNLQTRFPRTTAIGSVLSLQEKLRQLQVSTSSNSENLSRRSTCRPRALSGTTARSPEVAWPRVHSQQVGVWEVTSHVTQDPYTA